MTYRYHMRGNSLIRKLTLVMSEREQDRIIETMQTVRKPMVVSFLNAHAFNLAWKETDFRRSLVESDLLLRDGIGVSILLTLLRIRPGLNMNGTDLIPKLLERCHGSVALLGTREPYLSMAAAKLSEAGTDVTIKLDGFQPDLRYLDAVRESRPAVVILAMGMPKQERVALALKEAITWPCLIVNGGAILDFMSGRVSRAPGMLQALHLEWLFRLAREPRRLWRRYVLGNSVFLIRSLRIWRSLRPDRDNGRTLI
ncbi:exopolysaccharide biosynthesis WecB/TagA/CpsF family protein [Caballeronia udeis]|uniref:Exopolysaccharide biosynthesis WecB/TagA/CpsF family protein n=1 Tax=Caballeronia udeis TaxID=1232866 RepID=A0ABW8MK66_9BURK